MFSVDLVPADQFCPGNVIIYYAQMQHTRKTYIQGTAI